MTLEDREQARGAKRAAPAGFWYDRLIPALLILMGIVLIAIVVLSLVAMLGLIPYR
ncbi:MAG: hypothetical protein HY260_20210 [Chloroflexi bacterium]|nr:hypothetical protein [Chloroflexota bacterium]